MSFKKHQFEITNWTFTEQDALEAFQGIKLTEEDIKNKVMQIGLVTDKMIMKANIGRVTDPINFTKVKDSTIPTEGGLYSDVIFGSTTDNKRRQFAYIELHSTFFHPYVYEIIKKLNGKIEQVAAGMHSWAIENGELIKVDTEYDEDGDPIPGNTGLDWLIQNFRSIDFKTNKSRTRNENVKLLSNLSDDEIFISKWLVSPVFYRAAEEKGHQMIIPDLNKKYSKLLSAANGLEDDVFNVYSNMVKFNIQTMLVDIRQFGQDIIGGKNGIFRRSILGKSVDRGSRDVISTPTMDGCLRPEDNQIDIRHSGIPISKCLVLGYDFIMKYCLDFFESNFRNLKEYPIYDMVDGQPTIVGSIPIANQTAIFDMEYIKKRMKLFMNTASSRFDPIEITTLKGSKIPMRLSGMLQENNEIVNRPFTWCDLFYQACVATLHDKFVYITRFPIESENSQFPTMVVTTSTLKTVRMTVNGVEYTHYPMIDLDMPLEQMKLFFIDTVSFSNLFLKVIGGDYDGDTTIEKIVFSLEANEQSMKIINSVRYYLNAAGNLNKILSNESTFTLFNMTREE